MGLESGFGQNDANEAEDKRKSLEEAQDEANMIDTQAKLNTADRVISGGEGEISKDDYSKAEKDVETLKDNSSTEDLEILKRAAEIRAKQKVEDWEIDKNEDKKV